MSYKATLIALSVSLFTLAPAGLADTESGAHMELRSGQLTLHVEHTAAGYSLRVSGPGGMKADRQFAAWEAPYFELYGLDDGIYTWELREVVEARDRSYMNSEDVDRKEARSPGVQTFSGSFTIENGAPADALLPEPAEKTQQFSEDVIVSGSACIGLDCSRSESFGFDTLRFKENNLRIRFEDTSASSTFASNDWGIEINDSVHGGENYFSIKDATADVSVFKVIAGAPSNSLYVSGAGQVGFGTAIPAADLHVMSRNAPMLRLDQDGSGGFVAQTWDLVGNEQNFFIRDASHENSIPFQVETGAPNNALVLDSEGEIGLGTDKPARPIHIVAETAHVAFENTAGSRWNVGANPNDNFVVSRSNSGGKEIEVTTSGNIFFRQGAKTLVTFEADGDVAAAGAVLSSGDFCAEAGCGILSTSQQPPSIEQHAQDMRTMGYLPSVGETSNGDVIDLNQKIGSLIAELELAHEYIDQLNEEVKALRSAVEGN